MTVLAATGHRPDKLGGYDTVARTRLFEFARSVLREERPDTVISGMALGWDQAVAAAAVLDRIPLIAAVPFQGQESRWPEDSQKRYRNILALADRVEIISPGGYTASKMQTRNMWMADHCDKLAALWNGSTGGTSRCVEYARSRRTDLLYLWDRWIDFSNE